MHFERATRRSQEMNLTSLVDVVFLLIIFFMLTTSFVKINAIELSIPNDSSDETAPPPAATPDAASILDTITLVDIADDGRVYLNRTLIAEDDLQSALQTIMRDHKNMEILVRSAAHVNVQKLVDVMDVVHVAGGRKIAVDTWDGVLPLSATPTEQPKLINPFAPTASTTPSADAPKEQKIDQPTTQAAKPKSTQKTYTLSPRTQAARAKMYQPPKDAPVNSPLQRLRQQLDVQ